MKKLWLVWMGILIIALAGCAPQAEQGDNTINVVATIGMVADVVKNVGGEHIQVEGLMGPGVDPHLYKASESDVTKLAGADIIFYNGLHLEAQMGEVLDKMSATKKIVVVTGTVPRDQLIGEPDFVALYDPHVWFDVELWMETVKQIRDTLKAFDPEHADSYEQNAAAYLEELVALHEYVVAQANQLEEEKRILVTAHDAFNYFGKKYGFEVEGLQGLSTEAEAGTKDVQDLAQFLVDRKIKAIFIESSIPERNVKAVQAAAQAKGWDVQIGGELFSDAMGDEGTEEGTYIGMVKHNIDTIVGALS